MLIRPMRDASDRDVLQELVRATEMFTAEEEKVAVELMDIFLEQPCQRDYILDVLEDDAGRLTGYVCYGPTPMTEGTFDLYWIAVHPGAWRRGCGKALIAHMEKAVKQKQGRVIVIETSSQDKYEPTRQFYLRAGYVECARIRDFYRPGDDRIIYCKYL